MKTEIRLAAVLGDHLDKQLPKAAQAQPDQRLIEAAPALAEALRLMLEAYAPGADKTALAEGENALHSSVKTARAALRKAGV